MSRNRAYFVTRESDANLTLMFAKVNKGSITLSHLRHMNPKRFSNAPNVKRMLSALTKYGLFTSSSSSKDAEWFITPKGLDCMYQAQKSVVRLYPRG